MLPLPAFRSASAADLALTAGAVPVAADDAAATPADAWQGRHGRGRDCERVLLRLRDQKKCGIRIEVEIEIEIEWRLGLSSGTQ